MEQAKLAERLAGLEQGLVRGLALLRSGRAEEAEALLSELTRGVQTSPPPELAPGPEISPPPELVPGPEISQPPELALGPETSSAAARSITDDELELAFADAEPELEQMRDADDVAQEAMLEADRALEAEGAVAPDEVGENFATETMANLLERQGDESGAERIRAALVPAAEAPAPSRRVDALATLERWLENLRGGARV